MFTRRHFLKAAATVAVAPTLIPASALGLDDRPAPSNRLTTAVIGLGDRGGQHLDVLLDMPVTQVLAVCDPYRSKGEKFKKYAEDRYARNQAGGSFSGCAAVGTDRRSRHVLDAVRQALGDHDVVDRRAARIADADRVIDLLADFDAPRIHEAPGLLAVRPGIDPQPLDQDGRHQRPAARDVDRRGRAGIAFRSQGPGRRHRQRGNERGPGAG